MVLFIKKVILFNPQEKKTIAIAIGKRENKENIEREIIFKIGVISDQFHRGMRKPLASKAQLKPKRNP